MKPSYYNHIIYDATYSYWYNALTNAFFRISINTGRKLLKCLDEPEEIKNNFPNLYAKLEGGGFIVDDDLNEFEIIERRYQESINDKNAFIIIVPTLNCNYKCWYCIQDHIPSLMSEEVISRVLKHIDYLIEKEGISSLRLEWFGGEPLMYFNKIVLPISKYAFDKCQKANIPFNNGATTNAYFLTEEKFSDMKKIRFNSFQITIDGNKTFHDEVKKMDGLVSSFNHALININSYFDNKSGCSSDLKNQLYS